VLAYGPDRFEERALHDVSELRQLLKQWPVVWVNVDGLGDAGVIAALGEVFGLHRLALEDVVHTDQRAKIEEYGETIFMVARMPSFSDHLETEQLSLFLGPTYVLTFQEYPGDCFDSVRERIRKGGTHMRGAGPDYLAYALLDSLIDSYYPVADALGDSLEALETEALSRPERATVSRIQRSKLDVMKLRRALWPLREALSTLLRHEQRVIRPETRVYLRDCLDHTVVLIDLLESHREIAAGLMEVYLSSLSNRLTEVMKVLAIISTIFIPLGFIAGIYGMNFDRSASRWNMPELGWAWGYFFWRRGWLR
jgi:magnesium transporter